MIRWLIIGDVHSQLGLLKGLLESVEYDEVYLVGDLIDRDKESIKTLQFVMEKGYRTVAGTTKVNVELHNDK